MSYVIQSAMHEKTGGVGGLWRRFDAQIPSGVTPL